MNEPFSSLNFNFLSHHCHEMFISTQLRLRRFPCSTSMLLCQLRCFSSRRSGSSDSGKNFYDILGIPRNSSTEDIKKAYYDQSKQHHPDRKHGDERKFQDITAAYEVLGNPRLKKMYDRGLIAPDPTTVSTMYQRPGDAPGEDEAEKSQREREYETLKARSEHLDHYAKEQVTAAFAREQRRRHGVKAKEDWIKMRKESNSQSMPLIFVFLGALMILGYYVESKLPRKKSKSSES